MLEYAALLMDRHIPFYLPDIDQEPQPQGKHPPIGQVSGLLFTIKANIAIRSDRPDPRQRFHPDALSPQAVATWLEPLFNHNTYTSQRCTRLMYQAAQPLRGLAHGHKVIDHQHPICCRQVFPGYADGIHPALGIGADSRRILLCPSLVAPRTLLGKD